MSAIYDLFETPSPNKEEKQPLHARIVSKGTVGKEEFLDRVHKFTGISRSLLAGAMEAFATQRCRETAPCLPAAMASMANFCPV